jgi:hypothetical protein
MEAESRRDREIARQKRDREIKAVVEALSTMVNREQGSEYASRVPKLIASYLYQEHRTLQQGMVHVLAEVIKEYNNLCKQYGKDLRNEAAAEWASKVAAMDHYFPFI